MKDGLYQYHGYLERIYLQRADKDNYGTYFLDMDQKKWLQRAHLSDKAWVKVTFGGLNGDPKVYAEKVRKNPSLKFNLLIWPPEKKIASIETIKPEPLSLRFKITQKTHDDPAHIKLSAIFLESGSFVVDHHSRDQAITVIVPHAMDNKTAVNDVLELPVYAQQAGQYVCCGESEAPNFSVFGGVVPFRRHVPA